jgi:hypothetical protein
MSFLKRLYFLFLTLVLFALVVILLLSPGTANSWLANIAEQSVVVRAFVTLVIGVILFGLTYNQIRSDPRSKATGLMMRTSGAIAEVGVESVRERILKAVGAVPDVVDVNAQVKPVRGRADIELHVTVLGDDTELPAKQKEINRALNQVVNKQLGLQMAGHPRVKIELHREEIRKPIVLSSETPPSVVEISKPLPESKPIPETSPLVTEADEQSEKKHSILDWLGKPSQADIDMADEKTVHVVPDEKKVQQSVPDDSDDKLDDEKPDQPPSQLDVEADEDDTKNP